jgi:polyisoprenoid-binding protein YceI
MSATNGGAGSDGLLAGAVGSWTLDPTATNVEFHTKAMWGLAKVNGVMKATEGGGTVGEDGSVSGTLVIDAGSISTKNKKRDEHLRSADFLDVAKYPVVTYSVAGVSVLDDGRLKVSGSLTLRGVTHPLESFATAVQGVPGRVTLTVQAEVDRREWDMTWAKMGAKVDNTVVVSADFVRS